MATPSIVQSAFARGNTSPQTLTLSAAPTVGNWLVFVHTGYSNALSPPPGLTQVQTGSAQANEITEAWYRVVQSSDVTAAAHRYWRLSIASTVDGSYAALGEVSFAATAGGANLLTGGTPTASSSYQSTNTSGAYQPAYACDGNAGTFWLSGGGLPEWWQYDFGAGNPQTIAEVKITTTTYTTNNELTRAPSTFILQYSDDGTNWASAEVFTAASWTTTGQVQTFDVTVSPGTVWAFYDETDWANLAVFEISGVQSLLPANGANTGGGSTTLQTGSLNAAGDAACLRLLAVEWDTNASATTPSGWTLLSPSAWQGSATGNHNSGIWSIPSSLSGVQSLTMSAALNSYPGVWLDLQVSAIPPSMRVTQVGAEAWVGSSSANALRVTQAGAEVWLNLYRPPSKGQPAISVIC